MGGYGSSTQVGYKVAGLAGAAVAATVIFLPSFILMLSVLPMFERVRTLVWTTAAIRGVGPTDRSAGSVPRPDGPRALPDALAIAIFLGTLIALLAWRIGVIKLMMAGATVGVLRSRLMSPPGIR